MTGRLSEESAQASMENNNRRFQDSETYIDAVEILTGLDVKSEKSEDSQSESVHLQEGGFQIMVYNCSRTAATNNIVDCSTSREPALAVIDNILSAYKGRTLFITDDSVLGPGPNVTRPEDKVCIIHGLWVPSIVRRIEEQKARPTEGKAILKDSYVLVGECYVHGPRNGEGLKKETAEAKYIYPL